MQNNDEFSIDIYRNIIEEKLSDLAFSLEPGDKIFFTGDLGAGKSTFIRAILRKYFNNPDLIVRSPTYTYYQRYTEKGYNSPVYHFDLYRLDSLENIYLIGADDILRDPSSICLIEWPEILGETIAPTKKISITLEDDGTRSIEISTRRVRATV